MFSFLFLAFLLVLGDTTPVPETKEKKLTKASNDLSFDLLHYLKDQKNVFISPFSISTALALVFLGADGNTTRDMRQVLKYDKYELSNPEVDEAFQSLLAKQLNANSGGYEFLSSNNLLVQQDFIILHIYAHALRLYYSAQIQSVDFSKGSEVQANINSLVENTTRGKIPNFLDQPPSPDTKLFLLNAVYFIGNWLHPFSPETTRDLTFYNNGVDEKQVPTMIHDSTYEVASSGNLSATVVVLPYMGNNTASMIVVLPDTKGGVAELQEKLDQECLEELLNSTEKRRVQLTLPKFKLTYSTNLVPALTQLGLGDLFNQKADLSRAAGENSNLFVSSVQHKAVIDVNEKGSEAAAATGIEIVPLSIPPVVAVNHPFLFFIRDNSNGMILFSGRVDEL